MNTGFVVIGVLENHKNSIQHFKIDMTGLTLMLLVANLANTNWRKKHWKMTETLAYGYSSESAQQQLSNEYQHDRV